MQQNVQRPEFCATELLAPSLDAIERLVFLLAFPIRSPRKLGSHLHRHGLGHSADDVAMEIDGPRKVLGPENPEDRFD